jgi:hypothetical protein
MNRARTQVRDHVSVLVANGLDGDGRKQCKCYPHGTRHEAVNPSGLQWKPQRHTDC